MGAVAAIDIATATAHAIGGRMITFAVSVVLAMAGLGHSKHSLDASVDAGAIANRMTGRRTTAFPVPRKALSTRPRQMTCERCTSAFNIGIFNPSRF